MIFRLSKEDLLLIFLSVFPMKEGIRNKAVEILKREKTIDWHSIVRKACLNDVFPQVYYNLKMLSLEGEFPIPRQVIKTLDSANHMAIARSLVCLEILKYVLETSKKAGIILMPFKGIVLSEKFYPQRHLRAMDGIDLIIRRIDQHQNTFILLNRVLFDVREKYGSLNIKVQFHTTWKQNLQFWRSISETERIWMRTFKTEIGNAMTPIMSLEDTLLMNCYNSLGDNRINLRDICDIYFVLKFNQTNIDWNYIFDTAKRTWLLVPLYCTIYLLQYLFDVKEITSDILKKIEINWEVKIFKVFLRSWSVENGIFEIVLRIYKNVCKMRSLGFPYLLNFYLRNNQEIVTTLIGAIKSISRSIRAFSP